MLNSFIIRYKLLKSILMGGGDWMEFFWDKKHNEERSGCRHSYTMCQHLLGGDSVFASCVMFARTEAGFYQRSGIKTRWFDGPFIEPNFQVIRYIPA